MEKMLDPTDLGCCSSSRVSAIASGDGESLKPSGASTSGVPMAREERLLLLLPVLLQLLIWFTPLIIIGRTLSSDESCCCCCFCPLSFFLSKFPRFDTLAGIMGQMFAGSAAPLLAL